MTGLSVESPPRAVRHFGRRIRVRRIALYGFLTFMATVWLFPLVWAIYTALRPYADTQLHGYLSVASSLSLDNFFDAFNQGNFPQFYWNSLVVAIPGVIVTLVSASFVAFAVSRFRWRFNLLILMLFTAGNLLPQQVIIVPLYRLYLALPVPHPLSDNGLLYDQFIGIILIHVVFQTGFCVFVLSNYMKTLPKELYESAQVDGASVLRQFFQLTLPLCRPPIAALATLEVTWIYNEFFWATVLLQSGDKFPITSSLNNLRGQFFTDNNLGAAGSVVVALPPLIIFFILQKQFVSVTLGATKG